MAETTSDRWKPVQLHFIDFSPTDCDSTLSPIIFLHGLGSSRLTWNRAMRAIASRTKRKVYALDMRNHSKSEWNDEMNLYTLMVDLENFMNLKNISKAVLVGHSMGGKQAMALSLKKAHMVEKLVVEECTIEDASENWIKIFSTFFHMIQKVVSILPSSMSEKDAFGYVTQIAEEHFQKNSISSSLGCWKVQTLGDLPFHKNEETGCFEWRVNAEVVIREFMKNDAFSLDLTDAQEYNGPSLFIFGGHTFMKPKEDEEHRRKYFPNSELRIIEKGYHTLHVDAPEEYIDIVAKFLLS